MLVLEQFISYFGNSMPENVMPIEDERCREQKSYRAVWLGRTLSGSKLPPTVAMFLNCCEAALLRGSASTG